MRKRAALEPEDSSSNGVGPWLAKTAAAAVPAVVWAGLGCPLDVVKTRLQTSGSFGGPLQCLHQTIRTEGILALWKGLGPQLLLQTPYSVVMFGVYDGLRPSLREGPWGSAVAGAASGVAVTLLHNPLEVWRVRVQASKGATDAGVLRSLFQRPWNLGFRGASLTLAENVVGNGVYFGANEVLRGCFVVVNEDDDGSSPSPRLGTAREALVGGLTGIVFQWVVYPIDLVKARWMVMTSHPTHTVRRVVRDLWRQQGIRGLYRGASVMVLRGGLLNAAGWPAWQWARERLLAGPG